jgi:hypothetical protein
MTRCRPAHSGRSGLASHGSPNRLGPRARTEHGRVNSWRGYSGRLHRIPPAERIRKRKSSPADMIAFRRLGRRDQSRHTPRLITVGHSDVDLGDTRLIRPEAVGATVKTSAHGVWVDRGAPSVRRGKRGRSLDSRHCLEKLCRFHWPRRLRCLVAGSSTA